MAKGAKGHDGRTSIPNEVVSMGLDRGGEIYGCECFKERDNRLMFLGTVNLN